MDFSETTGAAGHRVIIEDRKRADLTGIKDLLIFDETEVVVDTAAGILSVRGGNLHMSSLNLERGQIGLEGEIREFFYDESGAAPKGKGGLGRLFRG